MSGHVKEKPVKVKLTSEDALALGELVVLERDRRKDPELGAATLLREYAIPRVYERLAELKSLAARSGTDRRLEERREPVEAVS